MPSFGPMSIRLRGRLVTAAAALLLTGCGGAGQQPPMTGEASPVTSAAPSPTPTRVELTVAEAGPRYLKIVAPYNKALAEFSAAVKAGKSLSSLRTLAGKVAEANATHARALRDTAWPAAARAPMSALLRETETAQRYWQDAAEATTATAMNKALRGASEHDGGDPAGQVRSVLGLPAYRKS
jgi:hypothetical protein